MSERGKWTPGPWIFRKAADRRGTYMVEQPPEGKRGHVAEVVMWSDAALIAAAPDLLALLIEARKWMDGDVMNDPWEKTFTERIDAAIAKAEGR